MAGYMALGKIGEFDAALEEWSNSQGKKSCSGPWVLTYRPWDLFHQTYSKSLNTFDGTDPMVDRLKPKVRNTIFFPCARPTWKESPTISQRTGLQKTSRKIPFCAVLAEIRLVFCERWWRQINQVTKHTRR